MQKTDAELTTEAQVIRDETTALANTKLRVYNILKNIVDSKVNNADAASSVWGDITGTITDQTDLVSYIATQLAALIDSSPSTLDTLNELAAALGDDPNFATTVATALGLKAPLASPTFTGTPAAPTPSANDNDTSIATTAYVQSELRETRTVTGTGSLVQTDDNSLIIFNSATPFNFTIDQLTVGSKFSWINYGSAAVTFINGSGVTIDGNTTASARSGNIFSSGLIDFSQSATAPKSISGEPGGGGDREAVAVSAGTLTLNVNSQREKNFDLTTTQSGAFTIAFSNTGSWVRSRLTLRVTGAIAVTLPAACIMDTFEVSNGRFVSGTDVLTLTGLTASPFMLEFVPDSSGNVWVFATNNGV